MKKWLGSDKASLLAMILGAVFSASSCNAATLTVQAKSYIVPVDLSDSSQFDADARTCEQAMAAVVDCGTLLGDNPTDGTKVSKNYRLWSELDVQATCSGDKIASWNMTVQQAFGQEFIIFSTSGDLIKPLTGNPSTSGATPQDSVDFSYRLRGQPNAVGILIMNGVKSRTCSYIWHEVSGTLTCQQNQPKIAASITGSAFPSHKLWVQGTEVTNVPQGPFKNLWKCDPDDPTSVQ